MKNEPASRELSPEEMAIRNESPPPLVVSKLDAQRLSRIWREMRRLRPHLYVVLRAYVDGVQLRDDKTRYSHGLYRGFYAELATKLGVTENSVKSRLKTAIRWFTGRVTVHLGETDRK